MARTWATDYLQAFPFWLADIGPLSLGSLPIFLPMMGFASATAPEISLETEQFREANWPFMRKVVKGATVNAMTLTRGATFYDADFYNWIRSAIFGDTSQGSSLSLVSVSTGGLTYRRTMMLVHFFTRSPLGNSALLGGAEQASLLALGAVASGANGGDIGGSLSGLAVSGGLTAVSAGIGALMGGNAPFEFAARVPARIYLMTGCIPTRVKVGSDFDATSSAVSVQELDMEIEMVEQLSIL